MKAKDAKSKGTLTNRDAADDAVLAVARVLGRMSGSKVQPPVAPRGSVPIWLTEPTALFTGLRPRTIREWCQRRRLAAVKSKYGHWMIIEDDHLRAMILSHVWRNVLKRAA